MTKKFYTDVATRKVTSVHATRTRGPDYLLPIGAVGLVKLHSF